MKRKVRLLAVLLVFSVLFIAGCSVSSPDQGGANTDDDSVSDTLRAIREKGTLVVGSSNDAPFAYLDTVTGEFLGVDAEIIIEVAKRLGIENVEMSVIPFSELITNVNMGNIDIVADAMYVKEERQQMVYFGDYWYFQGEALVTREGSYINGVEDFTGEEVVGYTEGTIFQPLVQSWADQGIIKEALPVGDQPQLFLNIQTGKIDACVTDGTVVEFYLQQRDDQVSGLTIATDYEMSEIGNIAPAVPFKDKAFMAEINAVLDELYEEGFVEQVMLNNGLDPSLHVYGSSEERRVKGNVE